MHPLKKERASRQVIWRSRKILCQTDECILASGYLFPLLLEETITKSWDWFQEILSQYQVRELLNCDPACFPELLLDTEVAELQNSVLDC